jgi:tRNA-splicing ligase RtcB (3'-phosphate/5'-hydroxy nucleic acid ligase)
MIKKKSKNIYEIKKEGRMKVPGVVFASEKLLKDIERDGKTLEQVRNAAMLPGIVKYSIAMPDAHMGYGLCVGGVIATDIEKGIISPGSIGYDINCGVRLLRTNIKENEFMKKIDKVLHELSRAVPSGVGRGATLKLSDEDMKLVLEKGSEWMLANGYATKEDLEHTEDYGRIDGARADKVSMKAIGRGRNQLGSIGAGNHFVEIQMVDGVFDKKIAEVFGLEEGQIVILIHTGSRGLGHQTASDYILKMEKEYGWDKLPDRQLICAPIESELGKNYRGAMAAAANFAFANRQMVTYEIRKGMKTFFPKIKVDVVYDIAHNIAKFEEFEINGEMKTLCVHRKGATRSFGPGRKEICKKYRKVGQPIFIPGSMGTFSYVLVGTEKARELSFASTAHGAGRVMSRTRAKKELSPERVRGELERRGVRIKAGSEKGMVEEAPEAYKDVDEVVRVSDELGIGRVVARLKPVGVLKG